MSYARSKKSHYQSLANYYRNLTILKKYKAAVHLEAKEDELFWGRLFKYYFPQNTFRFITYSKSHNGNKTTGSSQCLAYRDYLSKEFVVCIDSDYNYIFRKKNIDIHHFIFQTYTYSFENHICFSKGLSEVCRESTGFENKYFDFEKFFREYSNVIYEFFVWHIILNRISFKLLSIKAFWDVITLSRKKNDLMNQSRNYLATLKRKVSSEIKKLKDKYPMIDIDKEKIRLQNMGIYKDNVYLFVRGHNIYSLCVSLGRDVCEWILAEEKEKLKGDSMKITQLYNERTTFKKNLKRNILFRQYAEICKIESDMEMYARFFNS